MSAVGAWVARHRKLTSGIAIGLVAAVPLTAAVLHPGFPVNDVDLTSRDVWVTNSEQLLGGRLNRQIDELNGSVVASSPAFDVLQHGDALFLVDPDNDRLESVDPATTRVSSSIDLPPDAEVAYGGDVIAILGGGKVWGISAVGDLQFNYVSQPPLVEVGDDAHVDVTRDGEIVVVAPGQKTLYRIPNLAALPEESPFPAVGDFQLAVVGDRAVVLDRSTNELVTDSGRVVPLGDEPAVELQQSGPASDSVVLATGTALLRVGIDAGGVERLEAEVTAGTTDLDDVAAPVNQDGCAHGAWAHAQRYLLACEDGGSQVADIPQPTAGNTLEFRVNRSVIALNDLDNGNVWLPSEDMRLVDNWDDIIPPEEEESDEEGDQESAIQSFEDTLAERTEENRQPTAVDDEFGIRPGRTTILSVLDNDSDPDGDVLVVDDHGDVAESTGLLDLIDGGRALQFTPAPGFVGAIAFDYTVDDGRGGTSTARVSARVVPDESNQPPVELRRSGVSVEANQTVEYNVLANWRDPDGDDLYLVGAAPKSGDLVRFTPDGLITFTHQTSQLGEKEVQFQVTDGRGEAVTGTLMVEVERTGGLTPVGTPDFATTFVDQVVIIDPLANDISPSGAPLGLAAITEAGGASLTLDTDKDQVRFSASAAGIYYFTYTLQAGGATSIGIVRVDVKEPPADEDLPPVAVKDTAYLRDGEPVTVSVLSNDVSPAGKILAIQSVDVPAEVEAKGLVVELLASTLLRVTSTAALTEQVDFTYTVSDGARFATAGVTVVPVPALTKHQPPVAKNDTVTVRAGDIVTVDVLENDFHPDDTTMYVADELVTAPSAGIAFVNRNTVRFQAPHEPGEYRADYRVMDPHGETAAATVIFTVTEVDQAANRDPAPAPIVARVLAGNSIRVDLPLQRIDPDGDSTQLLRFPTAPALGTVVEQGTDYFVYDASPVAGGTDEFRYQVYDAFGATGEADIRIAVIPKPDVLSPPNAVPDSVSIRPGRLAQVDLLANDSDPQGAAIEVSEELLDVPDGIDAEVVDGRYLVVRAPDTEQSFSLRYELTNDSGGSAKSYVLVQVTPDAQLLPPSATDVPLTLKDIAAQEEVTVDLFDGYAFNPSGRTEQLVVSIEGPHAGSADLVEGRPGEVVVRPAETRQAIAYRVTNEADELSAMAFILVPAAVDEDFDDPPYIDPNLPTQYVSMNESREWNLSDLVVVPSGREAWIFDPSSVTSVQSNGEPNYVDRDTIRYQGARDYRGPASINFTVTDGASADDPKGNVATLTLPIVVGDPEFRDTPPEFTPPTVQVEQGEEASIDLRSATSHPNPRILQEVTYSNLTGTSERLSAGLSGSQLTVETPPNVPKGTTFELGVTLRWDRFEVPGSIQVVVVASSRAPAVAVADELETQRGDGTVTVNALANDSNPFQTDGIPLTIVAAAVQNTGEPAGVVHTADTVSITPDPSLKSGTIVVVYTIQDATEDPDRHVNGTITLVVSDVPDPVQKPTVPGQGDEGTVLIGFQAPASNGKPITSYEVRSNPPVGTPTDCAPPSCLISGLTNGESYQFSVRALNVHGPGAWSPWSNAVIPYGTPTAPQVTLTTQEQWAPGGAVRADWTASTANGGTLTYLWELRRGGSVVDSGSTSGTTTPSLGGLGAGSYTVQVVARNSGGKESAVATSNTGTITAQAVPPRVAQPSVTVTDGQAPGAIRWNWGAVSASPGGTAHLTYEVNYGSGWQSVGTDRSFTRSGLSQGTHSLQVRAVNKAGAGQASPSASGTVNAPPPPPASTEIVGKTADEACDTGGWGCQYPIVRFNNITPGTYTLATQLESGWTSGYPNSGHVSSGGTLRSGGKVGDMTGSNRIRVIVNGPSGNITTRWYTAAEWNALG